MNHLNSLIQATIVGLLMLLFIFFVASNAYADANEGEYLGYRLGETFNIPKRAGSRGHITGAMVVDLSPKAHPHHVDSITLYVSPVSLIIGGIYGEWYFSGRPRAALFADRYLDTLADKYPKWRRRGQSLTNGDYQLWVTVEERPPIVQNWPSHDDYRVGVGLIYAPDSSARYRWMTMLDTEGINGELTASK
ncbi:MAG: hypothetical protein GTO71_06755 [Woeseiaceae bacterium]|nr:hypothetical protein [Woeseiaceae bacterium]NIP20795.1 hypothetical protein [Woeseiaceae bacterium]NIS89588.1 hypothetical protein [Woeseiaceae bacterium]